MNARALLGGCLIVLIGCGAWAFIAMFSSVNQQLGEMRADYAAMEAANAKYQRIVAGLVQLQSVSESIQIYRDKAGQEIAADLADSQAKGNAAKLANQDNADWAGTALPDDYVRLLQKRRPGSADNNPDATGQPAAGNPGA